MSIAHMNAVWSSKIADPQAKLVLLKLADCADKDGTCWPSLSTIAGDTELHKSTVCRKIEWLEWNGWIKRSRIRNGCSYQVFMAPNQSHSATPSAAEPVADSDTFEDETSRTLRLPSSPNLSHPATQPVAPCDSTSRTVRLAYKEPPENHQGTTIARAPANGSAPEADPEPKPPCTIEQAITFGTSLRISREACEWWWHSRNAAGWHRSSANGHPRKITGWQSDLSVSRTWAEEEAHKANLAKLAKGNGDGKSVVVGGRVFKA